MDHEPALDHLSVALTRPPLILGVRYEVFAIIGIITLVVFIATGALKTLLLGIPLYFVGLYLCNIDPFFFHILEVLGKHKRAVANVNFWGARSYGP
jgi:type IV secretion system protein VirB3